MYYTPCKAHVAQGVTLKRGSGQAEGSVWESKFSPARLRRATLSDNEIFKLAFACRHQPSKTSVVPLASFSSFMASGQKGLLECQKFLSAPSARHID